MGETRPNFDSQFNIHINSAYMMERGASGSVESLVHDDDVATQIKRSFQLRTMKNEKHS
jgi:hypothetical protein